MTVRLNPYIGFDGQAREAIQFYKTVFGGELTISWAPGEPIRMRGSATHVFKGEIELEQFAG